MSKLFLIVLGGKPKGRNIEQHDVVFAVGEDIRDTEAVVRKHWKIDVHIDSYMVIEEVDGYRVYLSCDKKDLHPKLKLFFINLGGYKANDLEEYHKKLVIAALDLLEAKELAKKTPFYTDGLQEKNARGHVDDRMALLAFDVDDTLLIDAQLASQYCIVLKKDSQARFEHNIVVPGYRLLR